MSRPAAAAAPAPATRRARQRQATVAEIKALARRQLAEHGTGAVNLRAIAREMGTAPSALYRYFASHDELISALCADASDAVAAGAADPARTQIPPDLPAGVLLHDLLGRGQLSGASHLAAIAITAWASILGYLTAEIFGSLHQLITDPARLWDAHLRTVMLGMGFSPALTSPREDQPSGT